MIQRSLRFDVAQWARLEAMAAAAQTTTSDVLRGIIRSFFDAEASLSQSHRRVAQVAEYTQAALDTIILQDHPEHRDSILAETARRMERYHGAR